MAVVDAIKDRAYFKRFQVKFRRRREGKTDYFARKRLITQSKAKYNTPKYRCVVRFTNKNVIVQFAYSKIAGDVILAQARSTELKTHGLKVGLTNYAAAYATGLLAARRVLTKLGLADQYEGLTENLGEDYTPEENDEGRRPFKAFLDVGLLRTSKGARVFAALKGVCDGGVNVPHSSKHFYGESSDDMRARIFGAHVATYMAEMKSEDAAKFKAQFSQYIAAGVTPENLEETIAACHASIRADPTKKTCGEKKSAEEYKKISPPKAKKASLATRRNKVAQKIAAYRARVAASLAAESDSEDEE